MSSAGGPVGSPARQRTCLAPGRPGRHPGPVSSHLQVDEPAVEVFDDDDVLPGAAYTDTTTGLLPKVAVAVSASVSPAGTCGGAVAFAVAAERLRRTRRRQGLRGRHGGRAAPERCPHRSRSSRRGRAWWWPRRAVSYAAEEPDAVVSARPRAASASVRTSANGPSAGRIARSWLWVLSAAGAVARSARMRSKWPAETGVRPTPPSSSKPRCARADRRDRGDAGDCNDAAATALTAANARRRRRLRLGCRVPRAPPRPRAPPSRADERRGARRSRAVRASASRAAEVARPPIVGARGRVDTRPRPASRARPRSAAAASSSPSSSADRSSSSSLVRLGLVQIGGRSGVRSSSLMVSRGWMLGRGLPVPEQIGRARRGPARSGSERCRAGCRALRDLGVVEPTRSRSATAARYSGVSRLSAASMSSRSAIPRRRTLRRRCARARAASRPGRAGGPRRRASSSAALVATR